MLYINMTTGMYPRLKLLDTRALYINMTTGMHPPPQAGRHWDALHQHDHRYVPPPCLKLGDTGMLYINMTTGMYPCLKLLDTRMLYINMTSGMYPPTSSWETPRCCTST